MIVLLTACLFFEIFVHVLNLHQQKRVLKLCSATLSLYILTFEGQYMKFYVYMLLTCILYRDAEARLFKRTVCKLYCSVLSLPRRKKLISTDILHVG